MAYLKCLVLSGKVIPDGSTVLPTDDIQIWLHCAGIFDKNYTTISQVLADSDTLLTLMTTDNAVDYMIRSITWVSAICGDSDAMSMAGAYDYCAYAMLSNATWCEAVIGSTYVNDVSNVQVPKMTSATAPSGEVTQSSMYNTTLAGWKVFDGIDYTSANNNRWVSQNNLKTNQWVQYAFERAVKIYAAYIESVQANNVGIPKNVIIQASNDGTILTDISSFTNELTSLRKWEYFTSNIAYKYWRVHCVDVLNASNTYIGLSCVQFYGRENGGVQSWLKAGNIKKSYTTLAQVLADTTTLSALISNTDAVDYLVTAKGFIDGIVSDSNAMALIGANNYCANTLLNDPDWYLAIKGSTYASSVITITVPKMTGDTTPSGEAYASSYASNYQPWKAFSQSTSSTTCWSWSGSGAVADNAWLAYDFGKAVKINGVMWMNRTTSQATRPLGTLIVQGSNDKSTWVDVSGILTGGATASASFSYHFTNSIAYRHYRVLVKSTAVAGDTNLIIQQLQFYGREDV